jgi:CubicO group peptidase (beta-lactamase class C family)
MFIDRFRSQLLFAYLLWSSLGYGQQLRSDLPENNGMSSERLSNIDNVFTNYVDSQKLPGMVILVARNGKIVYHKSFGMSDVENKVPMTNDKIFRIASQTKAVVSVGIMMLQEEGKLLLSDSLATYIPEFRNSKVAVSKRKKGYRVVKAKRPIRIRDLLTHTAGVGYGFGPAASQWKKADLQGWYFAHKNESILESVREMAKLPMDAHPGEAFVYGYSTDILGAVIEEISGKSLDVFLKERIFDRLGMVDTHFYLPAEKTSRLSVVYNQEDNKIVRADDDGEEESQGHYVVGPRKSFSGGAGLLSTSDDYARFLQMLLNGGIYNDSRILSRKSVELMIADQMNGDHYNGVRFPWDWGTGFGLGFSITNHLGDRGVLGSVGEFGWGGAYHSNYFVNPEEKLLAVYFTQVVPITLDDHQKLKSLVYQAIVD